MVKEKNKFTRVCPRCGSSNVYSNPAQYLDPNILKCKNCDYNGIMVEVEDKNLAELQRKLERRFSQKFKVKKNNSRAGSRKAQLKIQETAFMLLALAFLFALLFIFYSNYQVKKIYSEKNKLLEEQAISLLEKFMAMPEFSCLQGECIDEDKFITLRNMTSYNDLWRGISKIEVVKIYPQKESIIIYRKGKDEITYSSFIPLCKTRQSGGYVWQECSLAKLLISIEKAKLERR